jgi:hypothetical protein
VNRKRKEKEGIAAAVENMMINNNNSDDQIVTNPISKSSFKRKLEFDPFEDNKKTKLDNRIKLKPFKRKQQNKRKLDIETDDDDDAADGDIITKTLKIT